MIAEPVLTWNLFIAIVVVPFGLFLVYTGIKRLLDKRDREDCEKEKQIKELLDKTEKLKDTTNAQARLIITDKIEALHEEIIADRTNTKEAREEIIDKLKVIDHTLQLMNGSVKGCQLAIELHKQDKSVHVGD